MGLRLKKALLEAKPETSKANVVKRFGAQFRKAFAKKKQSHTQPLKEAFVQEFQPAITAHPSLFPQEEGLSLRETGPGVVQGHIGVEENSRIVKPDLADSVHGKDENLRIIRNFGLGIDSQGFAVTTPPEPAGPLKESVAQNSQQETQRQDHVEAGPSTPLSSTLSSDFEISTPRHPRKARRSSCPPPCTSSPDSNHSSETLFSTPRHSEALSSPTFTESRCTADKHGSLDSHCWLVLAEHLKAEEQDAENTKWEIVVEWMKFAHQTEVAELQSQIFVAETILDARDVDLANEIDDHDADRKTIETLEKERSVARKRLSKRTTELRNAKKEVEFLKKSIEETLAQQSVDEFSPEHEDMEEGGVRLAGSDSPHMTEVGDLQEDRDAGVQLFEETGGETNAEKHEKRTEKGNPRNKESSEEKKARQQELKQQLLDESTPEEPGLSTSQVAAIGEVKEQATLQKASGVDDNEGSATRVNELEKQNETLEENLEYATDEVARLRSEAKTTQEEVKKLRAENHFAQLEVGHCHAANAYYRAQMEDENPARTAHVDGYLKRKDEAYAELEMRATGCAEELAEETKNRAIDNVYAEGKINGLKKELAHQSNIVAVLTEGREFLKEQKEEILQMFKKKIFPSDIDEAFRHDYDVIRQDNSLLIKMVNERRYYLEGAEKPVADLKAEKLILENAARSDQLKQRQMQQCINGLDAEKGELQDKVEILTELRQEAEEEFNGQIKQQAEEIERLLRDGAEDGWMRRSQAQAQELASCRGEVTRLAGLANQWQVRAMEVQDDFCPMLNCAEVRDWNAEESRWRLHHAERRAPESEKKSEELEKQFVELEGKFKDAVRDGKKTEVREPEPEPEPEGSKLLLDRADAAKATGESSEVGGRSSFTA